MSQDLVYDAWNRLVQAKDSAGNVLQSFTYDGTNRRLMSSASGTTTDFYYSDQWQVLEEQAGGQGLVRYVWSPVYVNALVLRDRDTDGDGTMDERLYVQQDANWNVTAMVSTSGTVVERYDYTAYGPVTVLAADWSSQSRSGYDWVYLHQGGRFDPISGFHRALEGSPPTKRPLTHELMASTIVTLGGQIQDVLVWDFNQVERFHYAKLRIRHLGQLFEIDSRPSDALALAIRSKVPFAIAEHLLTTHSAPLAIF